MFKRRTASRQAATVVPAAVQAATAGAANDRLVAQIKELGDQIDSYTSSADKYFGLVGTLGIATVAVVARPDGRSDVLNSIVLAAPLILLVILHYVAQILTERGARVGVKRAIEDHLSRLDPRSEVRIETRLRNVVGQKRLSVIVSMILFGFVAAGATVGGFEAAHEFDHDRFGRISWSLLAGVVLMLLALAMSTAEMLVADSNGYREASGWLRRCAF
ncbi:hypothetical protein [Kribbella sp. NPDC055071]